MKSPSNIEMLEQEICISCGICCDGTLFNRASLEPGEKGQLPEKIEQNYFQVNGVDKFKLPCLYFDGKCTIYDQKKAIICSAFRCQLLNNFSVGKISINDTMNVISKAKTMRKELFASYRNISGEDIMIPFR